MCWFVVEFPSGVFWYLVYCASLEAVCGDAVFVLLLVWLRVLVVCCGCFGYWRDTSCLVYGFLVGWISFLPCYLWLWYVLRWVIG